MAARETTDRRDRRITGQDDTNLFGGEFTPFRDLWQSLAGDLGITTKRMRTDALERAAEEEAIWRDTSAAVTKDLNAAREAAVSPEDEQQLTTLETQLDMAQRMRQSSNPRLAEAGVELLGQVTSAQRAFGERQETQRIARETQEATVQREVGQQAWTRMQEVADDLSKESAPFLGQKEAWGRIKAAAVLPGEAGDYALLYAVHKMLDPASTVLASEFQNSQNLAGVPDILVTARNALRSGERLTPERRADFVEMAQKQYEQSSTQQSERNTRYMERARAGGVPDKYLERLAIPVFSPGDSPSDFKSAAEDYAAAVDAATAADPNAVQPTVDGAQPDSTARQVGDSVRNGIGEAGGWLADFIGGMINAHPPKIPQRKAAQAAGTPPPLPNPEDSLPPPPVYRNGTRRGVYVPQSMRRRPVN